jgi:hypothetical protein
VKTRRRLLRVTLVVVGVLVVGLAAAAAIVIGPRNVIGMLRYDQRTEGSLKTGERAPDVPLVALDGSGEVRLSSRMGQRPLVLVFGSFT